MVITMLQVLKKGHVQIPYPIKTPLLQIRRQAQEHQHHTQRQKEEESIEKVFRILRARFLISRNSATLLRWMTMAHQVMARVARQFDARKLIRSRRKSMSS